MPRREARKGGRVIETGDRVQRAVLLPGGRIAAQLYRMWAESTGIARHEGFLDIVDVDLREIAAPIRVSGATVSG